MNGEKGKKEALFCPALMQLCSLGFHIDFLPSPFPPPPHLRGKFHRIDKEFIKS